MKYSNAFLNALSETLGHEGTYSADELDPGRETFQGISSVFWPRWAGWTVVDKWVLAGLSEPAPDLTAEVRDFYLVNFWSRFQGDAVAELSPEVACSIFDIAVQRGVHSAVVTFQDALNLLNRNQWLYSDLLLDGVCGKKTVHALTHLFRSRPPAKEDSEKMLLNILATLKCIHYIEQMRKSPGKEKFVGWFLR